MTGKLIVIVGGTGSGKSTLAKKFLAPCHPMRVLLYDVNNEHPAYTERYRNPFTNRIELPSVDDFIEQAKSATSCLIMIEETTMFFSNRGRSEDMVSILVRKRHTMNNIILVYHSLRDVPKYLMVYINYLIILKTNFDTVDMVEKKFERPDITEAFKEIQAADWIVTPEGNRYSPNKMLFIS